MLTLVALAPGSLAASPHLLGLGVPLATNDAYGTPGHTTLVVPAPGVLANDTDVLGAHLTARLATKTSHGNVTLSADGGFTYQPDGGFSGVDTFTLSGSRWPAVAAGDGLDHRRASPVHARSDADSDADAHAGAHTDANTDPDADPDPDPTPTLLILPLPTIQIPALPIPTPSLRLPGASVPPSQIPPLTSSVPGAPVASGAPGPSDEPVEGESSPQPS